MFAADCCFYSPESLNPQTLTEILAETAYYQHGVKTLPCY